VIQKISKGKWMIEGPNTIFFGVMANSLAWFAMGLVSVILYKEARWPKAKSRQQGRGRLSTPTPQDSSYRDLMDASMTPWLLKNISIDTSIDRTLCNDVLSHEERWWRLPPHSRSAEAIV